MAILIKILAVIGLLAIIAAAYIGLKFRRVMKESYDALDEDYKIIETADWFGKTGLDEATERELPHYLRREFGERLSQDPDALKANDLKYLGKFTESEGEVHYWEVPSSEDELYYAYVIEGEHSHTGWGNRNPPNIKSELNE